MEKKNLLVTLADKNYVNQAKQLFSSAYWNAGWKGDYMLLSHEIPEKELKWFRDKGILIKKCKSLYNKIIGTDGHPGTVVTKFYLFTPEFKKWKNVIYLDADIIVESFLDKLTRTKRFSAVSEIYMGRICSLERQFDHTELKIFHELKKEYNLNLPSFSAGVISFNTDIINENTFSELKNLLDKYNSVCHYGEQAILNLFFYKKWGKTPFLYNVCVNYFSECPPEKAIIFHFAGVKKGHKPWESENDFYNKWKNNLEKAELIDLTKIPKGKKLKVINLYLYYLSFKIKPIFLNLSKGIDRNIGKIGIFLKNHSPSLYHLLKNCMS